MLKRLCNLQWLKEVDMKIYIKNSNSNSPILDVEVIAYHPIFDDIDDPEIAAAEDISPSLSDRPVISKDKNKIKQWMVDDFAAFVENIECLCEQKYKLIGTYKNSSKDNSYYYNYLAQDDKGNIIIDCRLRLRISNHDAHSTKGQQRNKNSELNSEKLHELLTQQQIDKLNPYTKVIVVNDEVFNSYDEAYFHAIDVIEHAVKVMKRKVR